MGEPRVITGRRTVTDCAKTIKGRDSLADDSPGTQNVYVCKTGEKERVSERSGALSVGDLIPLCSDGPKVLLIHPRRSTIPSRFSFRNDLGRMRDLTDASSSASIVSLSRDYTPAR